MISLARSSVIFLPVSTLRTTFENSNGNSAGTWATSFASLSSIASV
jgi:hypothetical protein